MLAIVALWHPGGVLVTITFAVGIFTAVASFVPLIGRPLRRTPLHTWGMVVAHFGVAVSLLGMASNRSEEHTSELQSLMRISYAVFCLKQNKTNPQTRYK